MDRNICELSLILRSVENVSFLLGAGISTNSGIPDYRSNGNFVDDRTGKNYPPEIAFSRQTFVKNPDLLRYLKRDMIGKDYKPTIAHAFLGILEKKNKLGTVFTQNIDCLEFSFIKNREKIVQLHGSLHTIRCGNQKCLAVSNRQTYASGEIKCPMCTEGYLRPDIILYGEDLNNEVKFKMEHFITTEQHQNNTSLIISGTSFKVMPAAKIGKDFYNRGAVFNINGQTIEMEQHVDLIGDCDLIYLKLIYELGWINDLFTYFDSLCENSKRLLESYKHEHIKRNFYGMILPEKQGPGHILYLSTEGWFREVMRYKIDGDNFGMFDLFIYCIDKSNHGIKGLIKSDKLIDDPTEENLIIFYKEHLSNIPFFQNILGIIEKKNMSCDDDFE